MSSGKSFALRRRKERAVNITSRVDTCISSTRVSSILVQSPLYSPSFPNCSPLSIDTSYTTFHDTFIPLAMHTLTYVVRFLMFRAKLAYSRAEWIALQRLSGKTFVSLQLFLHCKVELQRSDKLNTLRRKNELILSRKDF